MGSEPAPRQPTRLSMLRSIGALGRLKQSHSVSATTVVGTALRLWCDRMYPGLGPTRLRVIPKLRSARPLVRFVDLFVRLPLLDGAYWLSTAYSALSSESYRKSLAMFFTPPRIADRLITDLNDERVEFAHERFIDPACGGAAFLALVASRMREQLLVATRSPRSILRHAETHLSGIDLDPTLCALSRHLFAMVFHTEIRSCGYRPTWDVICADSLECYKIVRRRYDVVISNPPFRKLSPDEVIEHRVGFSDVIYAQPNLYALFISLSVRLAKRGALSLGWSRQPASYRGSTSRTYARTYLQTAACGISGLSTSASASIWTYCRRRP